MAGFKNLDITGMLPGLFRSFLNQDPSQVPYP